MGKLIKDVAAESVNFNLIYIHYLEKIFSIYKKKAYMEAKIIATMKFLMDNIIMGLNYLQSCIFLSKIFSRF